MGSGGAYQQRDERTTANDDALCPSSSAVALGISDLALHFALIDHTRHQRQDFMVTWHFEWSLHEEPRKTVLPNTPTPEYERPSHMANRNTQQRLVYPLPHTSYTRCPRWDAQPWPRWEVLW